MKFVCQQGTVLGGSPIPKGYLRFGDREGPNPQTVGALVCGKDPLREASEQIHRPMSDKPLGVSSLGHSQDARARP